MRSGRDLNYIADRLLSPCDPAMEAHGRLIQVGENEAAERLMEAMKAFTDATRQIRHDLIYRNRNQGGYRE